MEIEKIAFCSEDGVPSQITFYPNQNPDAPVIICMPAMGVDAGYYKPLAEKLVAQGFHAVTADLRGHGESGIRPSRDINFGYYDLIQFDWPAVVETVHHRLPDAPLYLLGHSLGGQLSALFTSCHPDLVDGLILVASCNVHYKGFAHPLRTLMATQFLSVVADVLGYMPGRSLGFAGLEARGLIRDWARNARNGRYDLESSPINFERRLKLLRRPVLAISFEGDELAPKSAVENLWRKLEAAEVEHRHFTPTDLGLEKLSHFSWVRQSDALTLHIKRWIERVGMGSLSMHRLAS